MKSLMTCSMDSRSFVMEHPHGTLDRRLRSGHTCYEGFAANTANLPVVYRFASTLSLVITAIGNTAHEIRDSLESLTLMSYNPMPQEPKDFGRT